MQIVFDVAVDGKVKETIQPTNLRLKDIQAFIQGQASELIKKYGNNVYVKRRFIYN